MSGKPGIFCAQKRKNMGFQTVWGGGIDVFSPSFIRIYSNRKSAEVPYSHCFRVCGNLWDSPLDMWRNIGYHNKETSAAI